MATPRGESQPDLSHSTSEDTVWRSDQNHDHADENAPLLSNPDPPNTPLNTDSTSIYVKILANHLPWHKRPSAAWLYPLFALVAVSGGMLTSSVGQYHASMLCREYMNRHAPSNTTFLTAADMTTSLFNAAAASAAGGVIPLRPPRECQVPEILAYTAKTMALVEVLGGIAGTASVGYWASMSDKYGRTKLMLLGPIGSLFSLCALVAEGMWWDQIGLPLMVVASLVSGVMGGISLGGALGMAYAADCTDPSRRSLVYSWLHAGLFLFLGIGSFLGGTLASANDSIMPIIYFDIFACFTGLALLVFVVPESLPSKQSAHIQELYEKAVKPYKKAENRESQEQQGAWHSHMFRALMFFKPNGKNTNLILLGAISFLQMLALKGTFSVLILYTNRMFNWTEYEDGILFSLGSMVRLFALLVLLPVFVHFYRKHAAKKGKKGGSSVPSQRATPSNSGLRNDHRQYVASDDEGPINNPLSAMAIGIADPAVASSLEHLGEAALNLSDDEDSFEERRRRQSTVDSSATLPSTSKSSRTKTATLSDASRTAEEAHSDLKLDTWVIRIGFAINSVTYIGYGLATTTWMFYLASALHAVSIIASPSLKSLLTHLVEPSQFGAVLGAIQVVESVAGIFSPIVISWVFAATVSTRPEFVWYCCAALTGVALVLSFMVRQKRFVQTSA
ncbi:hypothetical protein BGZ70_009542 [Mortierella alpina]|uniref:Major facilitator superfamily (MFS) profile domain-containing protein n=1 Tax=Mortierella alpina TaxID=64518 RepID=A0A9P6J195_MORAP|nr:hypothetical protein BGZ70_009542 [Mortierella alpina]